MTYKVIQWTTGFVGREAVKGILAHPELELVGAYAWSPEKDGQDVGELCGIGRLGIQASNDIDALLALGDLHELARAQLETASRYDFDQVSPISDPAREAADLGAEVEFFDDQPPAVVSSRARLAHKAEHEGVICVEKIAGVEGLHPLDTSRIPGCTYCQPQVASIGLSEAAWGWQ